MTFHPNLKVLQIVGKCKRQLFSVECAHGQERQEQQSTVGGLTTGATLLEISSPVKTWNLASIDLRCCLCLIRSR